MVVENQIIDIICVVLKAKMLMQVKTWNSIQKQNNSTIFVEKYQPSKSREPQLSFNCLHWETWWYRQQKQQQHSNVNKQNKHDK